MTAADYLAQVEARAQVRPDEILAEHAGDCYGSLCHHCGHCLHSVVARCDCPVCTCPDAIDDEEMVFRRRVLSLVAALRAVLAHLDNTDGIRGAADARSLVIREIVAQALEVTP